MSAGRRLLFLALVVVGYVLIIPAQLATFYRDEALVWVATHFGAPGRTMLNLVWQGFPPGAFFAVVCILIGTVIVALAVGANSTAVAATPETRGSIPTASAELPWLWVGAAVVLSASTLYLCRLEEPTNIAVGTWVGSLICGLLAFVSVDRRRGTSLGLPFDSRRDVIVITLLVAFSLVVVAHDLMGWRWSGTPDESNFYGVAKAMAEGTAQRFMLSERGVFEVHPTLSSLLQTAFMMVLGVNGFAWRMSSASALAISLAPLYFIARKLWNARVATIAALLFGTTPVAVGFAHLGYNNSQLYPVLVGALALIIWAHRYGSAAGMYLAGSLAALGFYTYYPARLTPVLVVWLGICLGALSFARFKRASTAVIVFAMLLTIVPAAAHPFDTLGRMFQFTLFTGGGQEHPADFAAVWQLITSANYLEVANQSFMSLIYSVYFVGPHHFQWPPVVDPISGPLVLVGLWLCIAGLRRANDRFLVGVYLLSAFLIGGTSHYFRPPLTRLLFLSPFAALLAAIALDRLAAALARATRSPRLGTTFATALTVAAVVWGIGWMQYNVRYRYHGYGDGTTAELIRIVQQQPDNLTIVYLQRMDTSMWSVDDILDEYGMKERFQWFRGLENAAREALGKVQPPFIAVIGLGNAGEQRAAEDLLQQRFPEGRWQSSDPTQYWNLRYLVVN